MNFPQLKGKVILAPLENVSNIAFRILCRKYGASLAYTQQLSAVALLRGNKKSMKLIKTFPKDKPVGIQLFGRNPKTLLEAAKKYGKNFDLIDLNFGCPSRKIVEQGYGSALLKEKGKVKEIISTLVKGLDKPVTVKMRSGFKKVEALELVKVMEEAGVNAITLHARTREQGYSGKADWELIKKVKAELSIPVIGNGDVVDEESAERLLKETGCDYIMIGRGAMKNPFLFKRINHYLKTGEKLKQKSKVELFQEYYELCEKCECVSLSNLKQIAGYFSYGLKGGGKIREQLQKVKSVEEIFGILEKF
jgi:tRNA-dihydrouridine synthase B